MKDEYRGKTGTECPSGKAYAYPDGHVFEILPAAFAFAGDCVAGFGGEANDKLTGGGDAA